MGGFRWGGGGCMVVVESQDTEDNMEDLMKLDCVLEFL